MRTPVILSCLAITIETCCVPAQADHVKLPRPVVIALRHLSHCAKVEAIEPYAHDTFDYCGATISWDPDRAVEVKHCLIDDNKGWIELAPSHREDGALEYTIRYRCRRSVFLDVEIDYKGNRARVPYIYESITEQDLK
jgi:hypothetical protein